MKTDTLDIEVRHDEQNESHAIVTLHSKEGARHFYAHQSIDVDDMRSQFRSKALVCIAQIEDMMPDRVGDEQDPRRGRRISTLEQLVELRDRKRSVIAAFYGTDNIFRKPAAFVINMSASVVLRMFKGGMWEYVPQKERE